MSKHNLKRLFFKHNLLINIIGGAVGVSLSILLVYLQDYYSIFKIPGLDTAYPVALQINNVLLVFVTLVFVGLFSGFFSSLVVKKAKQLVYEPQTFLLVRKKIKYIF